ncbi:MAG: hypothetical protein C4527_00035 [Candidatus Omnitrophota bacterium]|nr:MAG: hypothetical protein C4527_00035 [Candidatus Omnitrophota bacterium]
MYSHLDREFQYYLDNQDNLVQQYNGNHIVIKNCKVIGVYENELEAMEETSKKEEIGSFLIQKFEPGVESYTQSFHSRVSFE